MRRYILPLCLAVVSTSTLHAEEPRAAWVATFNGAADGGDQAQGVAVTSDGHAYVAGIANDSRSGRNDAFVLILYRPDGSVAWQRVYEPQGRFAGALGVGAVEVDSRDRLVAVGWGSSAAGRCLFIARVDPTGQPDFLVTTPTDAYFGHYPPQVALDSGDGFAVSAARDGDYLVQRYDAAGSFLWEWTHDDPSPENDAATDVAIGLSGEVYVTGDAGAIEAGYTTFKLAPDGSELWGMNRFGVLGNTLGPAFIAIDPAGDPVVSATPEIWCGLPHAETWKYTSDGVETWSAVSDTCLNVEVWDMAVDGEGNVLVAATGYIDDPGNYDIQLFKYSPTGELLWRRAYDGPAGSTDAASALAVDDEGAAYVLGQTKAVIGDSDMTIIKYEADGTREWIRTYDSGSLEWPNDCVVSAAGDVIATGHAYPRPGEAADFVTVAYQQNGCAADVTGDGFVNRSDADRLQAAAGLCEGLCPEDLNGDRTVDQTDGDILRGSVGPCP